MHYFIDNLYQRGTWISDGNMTFGSLCRDQLEVRILLRRSMKVRCGDEQISMPQVNSPSP